MVLRVVCLIVFLLGLGLTPKLYAAEPPANGNGDVVAESPGLSELGARFVALVITSYSIHYTKLYEPHDVERVASLARR